MYEHIYDIQNFREYSLESSKMSVLSIPDSRLKKLLFRVVMLRRQLRVESWFINKKYRFFQKSVQRSILLSGGFLNTFNPCGHISSRPWAILYVFG